MNKQEFSLEYAKDINNIIHMTLNSIRNNNYIVKDKEKLLKTLVEYIYLNSHH